MPACDLISREEATSALGVAINGSRPSSSGEDGASWYSNCLYQRESYSELVPLELSVAVGDYAAQANDAGRPDGATAVTGLGEDASFTLTSAWGLSGPVGALSVRQGDAVLYLALGVADMTSDGSLVLVGTSDEQRTALVDLARIALRRLTSPPSTPATAKATCALITLEQASIMLGVALTSANDVDNHDAWGAECQYNVGAELELFVGVNSLPAGRQNFDACRTGGELLLGVGEEAFYDQNQCGIRAGSRYIANALLVRSGNTVLAVGEGGLLGYEEARAVVVDVARMALQQLGLDAGATPVPIAQDALVHPCSVLTDTEVGAAVGIGIATHYERSAVDGQEATCYYALADSNLFPLHLQLGSGPISVSQFSSYRTYGGYTPVEGLGDGAYQIQSQTDSDQPLVSLSVLTGQTLLELYLGGNGQSIETFKVIAPGTPAEQLDILRGLAELILPRLAAGGE